MPIGNVELQCYVLGDDEKTCVLTQAAFLEALGRHRKANVRDEGGEEPMPAILQGKALKPYISNEIVEKSRPTTFVKCIIALQMVKMGPQKGLDPPESDG